MMKLFFGVFAAVLFLTGTPSAVPRPSDGSATASITMSVSGTCPGFITIDITGATPFSRVGIAYSASTGTFTVPSGPCTGTVLGLDSSSILVDLNTDAAGDTSISGTVSSGACGLSLQAVDLLPCLASTVDVVP
ncbi:MAG: hypothetical protein ACYTEP_04345 [Planctomycetota bacterium]|jgi:hypothetical protein